jgi:hypothetical protein
MTTNVEIFTSVFNTLSLDGWGEPLETREGFSHCFAEMLTSTVALEMVQLPLVVKDSVTAPAKSLQSRVTAVA